MTLGFNASYFQCDITHRQLHLPERRKEAQENQQGNNCQVGGLECLNFGRRFHDNYVHRSIIQNSCPIDIAAGCTVSLSIKRIGYHHTRFHSNMLESHNAQGHFTVNRMNRVRLHLDHQRYSAQD